MPEVNLTIFTSPKAFVGHDAITQRNALTNWKALGSDVAIILMGNDSGVAEAACEFGCKHVPDIACSAFGTPMLDSMFTTAQNIALSPYIMFSNADILFPSSLMQHVDCVANRLENFMILGQRWNVDVPCILDPERTWQHTLWDSELARLRVLGRLFSPWGVDYFIFPRGSFTDMPPFIIGRPGWDTWLVWSRPSKGVSLVNASESMPIIHQNHLYAHVPHGNHNSYEGPEANENQAWIKLHAPTIDHTFASTFRANYRIKDGKCCYDFSFRRIFWFLKNLVLHRCIRFTKKLVRKLFFC